MNESQEELCELISRCAVRDQQALQLLYEHVAGYLNSVVFRIVKSDEWANDVLQETFIQIWENAGSYRPHLAKPLTWMTSIARYRAIDKRAKEQRHQNHLVTHDENEGLAYGTEERASPEHTVAYEQQHQQLLDCMKSLKDYVQKSLRLAYLEGYSRDEIANILDANANTVKSWLARGGEKIKRCLESKQEAPL